MVESGRITRSTEEWLISRSCHRATFSSAAPALARTRRASPVMFSELTGLRLWGMALEPFCPSANGSSASPISVRCRARISTAIFSSEAAMMASVAMNSAWRSRCTIWLETGAGSSPRRWHASSSTSGSMWAKVPTAPEIFPTRTTSRARRMRSRFRPASAYQRAALSPKVMGSAWMPWLRPTHSVDLWARASVRRAARRAL